MIKREKYIDSLKYFSVFLVELIHFFSFFDHPLTEFWRDFPYNLFLFGLGGKLGVSIFAVITGYFAYRSGQKRDPLDYIGKRYIYFAITDFFISSIYYFVNINSVRIENNFFLVIGQSLILGDLVAGEFWFARAFFLGSILCFFLGKYRVKFPYLIMIALILVSLDMKYTATYIANCVLGCVVDELFDKDYKILDNTLFQVVLFILVYILVKRDSSNLSYFVWGICGVMLMILAKYNKMFNKLCNTTVLSYFGQKTMAILMIHIPCLYLIDYVLGTKENDTGLFFTGIIWLVVVNMLAIPLNRVLDFAVKQAYKFYGYLYTKLTGLFKNKIIGDDND